MRKYICQWKEMKVLIPITDKVKFKPNMLWELKEFYTSEREKNKKKVYHHKPIYTLYRLKTCQIAYERTIEIID